MCAVYVRATHALATYRTGPLSFGPITTGTPSTVLTGSIRFTMAAAATVDFVIQDSNYAGNSGGVSIDVTAVPEPASWSLMITSFGVVGGALRRRPDADTSRKATRKV